MEKEKGQKEVDKHLEWVKVVRSLNQHAQKVNTTKAIQAFKDSVVAETLSTIHDCTKYHNGKICVCKGTMWVQQNCNSTNTNM